MRKKNKAYNILMVNGAPTSWRTLKNRLQRVFVLTLYNIYIIIALLYILYIDNIYYIYACARVIVCVCAML